MLGAALVTSVSWQVGLAARDAINTAPPESLSLDLQPLVDQLQERGAGLGRVEVVPTASHREATALAAYANLARGWNRQADAARNRLFYRDQPLTADAYQRWLRRWAVRFVVLSTATPDAAAVEEAALVSAGLPYLERVWSDEDWMLYEVRNPAPLASDPRTCSTSTPPRSRCTPEPRPDRGARRVLGGSVSSTRRAGPGRPRPRACRASPVTSRWRTRATTGWCCTPPRPARTGSGRPTRCRAGPPAPIPVVVDQALEPADLVAQLVVHSSASTASTPARFRPSASRAVMRRISAMSAAVAPRAPGVRCGEMSFFASYAQHRRAHAGELGGHGHAVDGVVVGGRSVVRRPHPSLRPSQTDLGQGLEISPQN